MDITNLEEYEEIIKNNENVMIYCSLTTCGPCKKVYPEYRSGVKKYRGKLNIVGLDANLYGRHAEAISMDPEIVPLFAIQQIVENKKYGINQTEHPDGPSFKVIEKFVADFFDNKVEPIIKSEPFYCIERLSPQLLLRPPQ